MLSVLVTSGPSKRILAGAAVVCSLIVLAACVPQEPVPTSAVLETPVPAAEISEAATQESAEPVQTEAQEEPTPEPGPTADPERYAGMAEDIEAALDSFVEAPGFSGTVLVARDGDVIFAKGYGAADRLADTPNDAQTRFRIGSVTKPFTAMLVLMMSERGLLELADPICEYVEDCPDAWSDITIEHLLTHTAGVPDFTRFIDYEATKGQASTVEETIDRFRDLPLNFEPGTRWDYTNSGYIVLGHILEQVSGQSYAELVGENIFQPLGMTNSGYDDNRDDLAAGYINASGAEADFIDMSIPHAAGALYSTAEDLLKWDRALAAGALVADDLQAAMFSEYAPIPDSGGFGYGYGWVIGEEFGQQVAMHSGGIEGFSANITRFLGDGTLIVMLSNEQQTNPRAVTRTIMQAIYAGD